MVQRMRLSRVSLPMTDDKVVEFKPKPKPDVDPVRESVASVLGHLADIQTEGELRGLAFAALVRDENGDSHLKFDYSETCDDSLALGRGLAIIDQSMVNALLVRMASDDSSDDEA